MSIAQLVTIGDVSFDYAVIAQQVAGWRKSKKKTVPPIAHLSTAITNVQLEDTINGSSTLAITISDPDLTLAEFFDVDDNGRVDPIDLNYPLDSDNWWRLTQLDIKSSPIEITLTFMERPAVYLMHHYGPVKASRGSVTRAEFFRSLVKKIQASGGLSFVSKELHKKQPVAGTTPVSEDDRHHDKGQGIHQNEDVQIKGVKATTEQLKQVERALDVANQLNAPDLAVRAMMCAGIGESGFKAIPNSGGSNYWGVFQGNKNTFHIDDTEGMARSFLIGGKGFQGGGAVDLAKKHSDWGPGLIAVTVEGSRSNFGSDEAAENFYGKYDDEGQALVKAYGGGFTGGDTYYRQQYNFQIGSEQEPHQSYWDGMVALAEEVQWRLFIDGDTVYFDSDLTLIKQKPIAIISPNDESVISWNATWDGRKICTEMTITLVCEPFEFRAGQVFKLQDWAMLSTGSTAKLPGRWLITDITRASGDATSTFTLGQPQRPRREPATERTAVTSDSTNADYKITGGSLRDRIVQYAKQSMGQPPETFYDQNGKLTDKVHPARGERSDCSQWVRAVYLGAGAQDPGSYTGAMLQKGKPTDKPKPGDLLCSPTHVELFIGNGKTIGHGSAPIDGDTVAAVKGRDSAMRFITYDFLDHEPTNQELSSKYGWGY